MSSFVHHFKSIGEFKLKLQSRNTQFGSKSMIIFVLYDLEIWWWPWKTIRHLFYTTLSFVHHFKAIGEFKLELQSRNAQFGSKSTISCPVWPWNLMDDLEKQKGTSPMLLQALCIIYSHQWIQTGVTVRKCTIWVKINFYHICKFKLELQSGNS